MSTIPTAPPPAPYLRLPGRARRMFGLFASGTQRLHMGEDHILVSTTSFATERYKRFYLSDIQSLTIQKSADGAILNFAMGAVAALTAAIAVAGYFGQWPAVAQAVIMTFAIFFLGIVLVNTVLGPTCHCHILTAVHDEPLYCLGRLYTAQGVVEHLRSIIEGVQGAAGDMAVASSTVGRRVERAAGERAEALPVRHDPGRVHMALFAALSIDGTLSALGLAAPDVVPAAAGLASNFTIVVLSVAAAIRQRDSDLPQRLRTLVWVSLIFNCGMLAVSMYVSVVVQMLHQSPDASVAAALQSGFVPLANGIYFAVNASTSLIGFYNAHVWRRAIAVAAERQRVASEESGQP